MQAVIQEFCSRYAISSIWLTDGLGVNDRDRIRNVDIRFIGKLDDASGETSVKFKLKGREADLCSSITTIFADGRIDAAGLVQDQELEVARFFSAINTRVAKIHHEQSIQSIKFLGSTFSINQKIRFTVTADDGGKLTIILDHEDGPQTVVMSSSGLLDGLYDGSIQLDE